MSPPIASGNSESGKARFAGSASSGILELIIFHPVDTVAKRLMSNQTKVRIDIYEAILQQKVSHFINSNVILCGSFGSQVVLLLKIRLLLMLLFSR